MMLLVCSFSLSVDIFDKLGFAAVFFCGIHVALGEEDSVYIGKPWGLRLSHAP